MIITRTPFRVTLGGGGTDLPSYYSKYGGFIFAAGINKYMFINVNRPVVDDLVRLKYSKTEIVENVAELKHDIARECLKSMGVKKAIEVVSMADVPAGTGLGSSSCYAVGLLNALHTLKRNYVSLNDLAEEACKIEIELLNKPIGKQDQYITTFGGLTVLEIRKDGKVEVKPIQVSDSVVDELNHNLVMFYTKSQRKAEKILSEQDKGVKKKEKVVLESLHYIKEIGYQILEAVEEENLTKIGLLFDKHWQYKKKMSSKISNPHLDKIYQIAKENGALGGKISGAGGGGFFVFYLEKNHKKLRKVMSSLGLREMKYRFDFEGTKILANF